MTNSLTKQKPKFSVALQSDAYKNLINNTLGDPARAKRFVASVSSAVATNPALQDCEAGSILSAALLGESLNLSPSPQLGQYYMVPYDVAVKDANGKPVYLFGADGEPIKDNYNNQKKKTEKHAQFQLGYKGYIQLAVRSGYYTKLNVLAIKEGELVHFDPLNEVIEAMIIEDEVARENAPTIGYYAMFEYQNGFRKAMYWSRAKMESHADRYSQAYSAETHKKLIGGLIPDKDAWKYSSFWYKDFDGMAFKTMMRQLISKWGIMSTELQNALVGDMAIIREDGSKEYVDNVEYEESPIVTDMQEIEPEQPPIEDDPLA